MSHIVTINPRVKDAEAVRSACRRLQLPEPVQRTVRLFGGEATGLDVQLPDWRYPVVCDTTSGEIQFDNYAGRWGERKHLDAFLQAYAIEKAHIEARRRGHTVYEQPLEDGSIKLTIQVEGGRIVRIIEVLVSPDGQTRVETQGFAGAECQRASRPIEEALGHKLSEQLTAEFHQANAANSQAEQRA